MGLESNFSMWEVIRTNVCTSLLLSRIISLSLQFRLTLNAGFAVFQYKNLIRLHSLQVVLDIFIPLILNSNLRKWQFDFALAILLIFHLQCDVCSLSFASDNFYSLLVRSLTMPIPKSQALDLRLIIVNRHHFFLLSLDLINHS